MVRLKTQFVVAVRAYKKEQNMNKDAALATFIGLIVGLVVAGLMLVVR